jgi:hypothetical protein
VYSGDDTFSLASCRRKKIRVSRTVMLVQPVYDLLETRNKFSPTCRQGCAELEEAFSVSFQITRGDLSVVLKNTCNQALHMVGWWRALFSAKVTYTRSNMTTLGLPQRSRLYNAIAAGS